MEEDNFPTGSTMAPLHFWRQTLHWRQSSANDQLGKFAGSTLDTFGEERNHSPLQHWNDCYPPSDCVIEQDHCEVLLVDMVQQGLEHLGNRDNEPNGSLKVAMPPGANFHHTDVDIDYSWSVLSKHDLLFDHQGRYDTPAPQLTEFCLQQCGHIYYNRHFANFVRIFGR